MEIKCLTVCLLSALAISPSRANAVKDYETPTQKVEVSEWPYFSDDLDFQGMDLVIERQLKRFNQLDLSGVIKIGGETHSLEKVKKSLIRFAELTDNFAGCTSQKAKKICEVDFNRRLKAEFSLYMPKLAPGDPRYGEEKQTLFTAYYTPQIQGRKIPDATYRHAVYLAPADEKLRTLDRVDIDFDKKLSQKGLEIFYAPDLFELYLLHVQGGGRVLLDDPNGQESFYISYAGANGKPFRFISKYMMEKKYIHEPTIYAQREFLKNNPDREREVYATCPSYVYFTPTSHPPVGSDRVPLTDNRSIATDINYYRFKGLLSFVMARRPTERFGFKDYSRFYLDQDTGGAIRGKARVDLYFGEGPYAEHAAYNTVQRGDLYFLILKN